MDRKSSAEYDVPLLDSEERDREALRDAANVTGYTTRVWKAVLFVFLCVCSGGLLFLLCKWLLRVRVRLLHSQCALKEATYVFVADAALPGDSVSDEQTEWLERVHRREGEDERWFTHKGLRYVFEERSGRFVCHDFPVEQSTFAHIHDLAAVGEKERDVRQRLFGSNVMLVPVPSYLELVVDELLHPFYVFQVASVVIWMLQAYYIYAGAILFLASVALALSVYQTKKNAAAVAELARHRSNVCVQKEGGVRTLTDSEYLVPGDIIVLQQGNVPVVCDAIILSGECVVNEASLTGESVPVIKSPLPHEQAAGQAPFDYGLHARHVLFCGTDLRSLKGEVTALVVRTGYKTAKGEMIRQILYPKALSKFTFYRDALIFILILFIITLGVFGWAIYWFAVGGASAGFTVLRVLDLFTIVIPPALPIAMTAGAAFAVIRLRARGIYCVVPKTVNIAGRVNVMCFDKTGTLTRDHMDVHCVRPATSVAGRFDKEIRGAVELSESSPLLWTLAACHSVVRLSVSETVGDPLEVKMQSWTNWTLSRYEDTQVTAVSPSKKQTLYTLARHEFSSQLARMSVVVRAPDNSLWALVKGSAEEIKRRCDPRSIPDDYDSVLSTYTAQGMRTIALAAAKQEAAETALLQQNRDAVERNLTFLGFLVMVNPLKEETIDLLARLQEARVRVVMITGDSALTAINVARKSGICVSEESAWLVEPASENVLHDNNGLGSLQVTRVRATSVEPARSCTWVEVLGEANSQDIALSGAAFEALSAAPVDVRTAILARTCVFARCTPQHKSHIVNALKSKVATVGMCGDGSNDCGALKAADAGISVTGGDSLGSSNSTTGGDAVVAAPFSARSISQVEQLLLEGRCALATSFALFKFMIMYSTIQFVGVIILYAYYNLFADLQFLWVDLFLILPLSFTMGLTGPTDRLVPNRPPATLFTPSVLGSIVGHVLVMTGSYAGLAAWTMSQPFITPANQPTRLVAGSTSFLSVLVTMVWLFGNFLYVDMAFNFSIGHPFRQKFYSNPWLLLSLVGATVCNVCWFFVQNPTMMSFWSIQSGIPYSFLGPVFGVVIAVALFTYLYEMLMIMFVQETESRREMRSI